MLPESVGGVAWRRGDVGDAERFYALILATDAVDDPSHPLPRGEFDALFALMDPAEDLLFGEADGAMIAFAWRRRPGGGSVRLLGDVHPGWRGRGIGRRVLAWQIADAQRCAPDAPMMTVRQAARSDVGRLAGRFGFAATRTFLSLRRPCIPPPEVPGLPEPLRSIEFETRLDEELRLAKNVVFRDHWQATVTTQEEWRRGQLGPELRRDLSRLAVEPGGAIAGFVLLHEVDGPDGDGYVPLVGTAKPWRGKGVARALLADVVTRCGEAGYPGVALHVDATSPTGADRLYAGLGFEETTHSVVWSRPLMN